MGEPTPIDWTKPIQFENGILCERVFHSNFPCHRANLVVFAHCGMHCECWAGEFGDSSIQEKSFGNIINSPPPPRKITREVAVVVRDGRVAVAVSLPDGRIGIDFNSYIDKQSAEVQGWRFGPRVTVELVLPGASDAS